MQINMASIMRKVDEDIYSQGGKERSKAYIRKCVYEGRERTSGGSYILTLERMRYLAEEMARMLKSAAALAMLPQSVIDNVNSLEVDVIEMVDTKPKEDRYMAGLSFRDDLYRPSLLITSGSRRGETTGEGIDNIVALFNNGMKNKRHTVVHGTWIGHEELGTVYSRMDRPSLHFIQSAVEEFNLKFGDLYDVYAYAIDTYM